LKRHVTCLTACMLAGGLDACLLCCRALQCAVSAPASCSLAVLPAACTQSSFLFCARFLPALDLRTAMDKAETYRPRVYGASRSADTKTAKAEQKAETKAAKPKSKAAGLSLFDLSSPASASAPASGKEVKGVQARADGRTATQLRPICAFCRYLSVLLIYLFACPVMKTGVISQAAGSAYIEINNTKVICGV
jgi:hypothetical protein